MEGLQTYAKHLLLTLAPSGWSPSHSLLSLYLIAGNFHTYVTAGICGYNNHIWDLSFSQVPSARRWGLLSSIFYNLYCMVFLYCIGFFFHCKSDTFLTYTNGMVALHHLQRVEYCQGWSFLFDFISSLSQSTWNACILNCLLPFSQSHIFLGFIHTSLPLLHVCPAAITKYLRLDMLFWRLQVYLAWNFGDWKSQRHRGGSNVSPPHPTTAVFCSRWHPGVSQWVKERFHWKAGDQRWSNRV